MIENEVKRVVACSNSPSSATNIIQLIKKEDMENDSNLGVSKVYAEKPVSDARQALAEQMGNFACIKTEDTVVGELV